MDVGVLAFTLGALVRVGLLVTDIPSSVELWTVRGSGIDLHGSESATFLKPSPMAAVDRQISIPLYLDLLSGRRVKSLAGVGRHPVRASHPFLEDVATDLRSVEQDLIDILGGEAQICGVGHSRPA
jgi:hypothetical protein